MKSILIFCFIVFGFIPIFSQEYPDSVEIFLIDAFVDEETDILSISYFTEPATKSRIKIDNLDEIKVSDSLAENHTIDIELKDKKIKKEVVPFYVIAIDSLGKEHRSENFEFEMPREIVVEERSSLWNLCLFSTTTFLLPYPAYIFTGDEDYWGITKEIPLIFIRATDIGYPIGYFSAEYSHIFEAPRRNFLRIGYKQLIEIPYLEYVSPGINGFTDFTGFNGISPEVSVGFFRFFDAFTLYGRYRFNYKPGDIDSQFSEVYIGLYSGFFALYF